MVNQAKTPKQTVVIGNRLDDADLIDRILAYKAEKNFTSAADAVRSLCEIALDFRKLMK